MKAAFEAGIGVDEFWECSLKEVYYKIQGYYKRIEREQKQQWVVARWLGTIVANTQGIKIQPKDLFKLPEEEGQRAVMDEETRARVIKRWNEKIKRRHG